MEITVTVLVTEAAQELRSCAIDQGRYEARLLLADVLGVPIEKLIAWPEQKIPTKAVEKFQRLIARRCQGEPVSRLRGWREFWSLSFNLSSETLDPRPDTECLVESVLKTRPDHSRPWHILDLGTGTGCLLLSLLHEYPAATGVGIDFLAGAVAMARQNSALLGLAERAEIVYGDWRESADLIQTYSKKADIIVANPPYIPTERIATLSAEVRLNDPWAALDGGADGLEAYRTLAPLLPQLIHPDGLVALETGQGQTEAVESLLTSFGMRPIGVVCDLTGIKRCVLATLQ